MRAVRHYLLFVAVLAAAVAQGAAPRAARATIETLWEHLPYQVDVMLAVTPAAAACGDLTGEITTALEDRAFSVIGARWTTTVRVPPLPLRQAILYDMAHITPEQVSAGLSSEECDKALLIRVDFADGEYTIEARDFDVRAQLFSPAVSSSVVQRQRLGAAVFQAMLDAFAPLGRVEGVDKDKVTLRMRAAAVPARDPSVGLPADNTVFRPVIRTNDKTGAAKRVQAVEWSYLVGEKVDGSQLPCRLVTAFQSPISGKKRGRIEQLALALRPSATDTVLELRSADKASRPLVGYMVYTHPVDSKETHLLGSTDNRGALSVPPDEGQVRVLLIKSGGYVMARLPLLPGLEPVAVAPVPDDQMRLQVEGMITGFQEEMVDLIARRHVLISRIKARLKSGKTDEAKKLLAELRKLRTQADFSRELTVERQRRSSPDPRAQKQIDKLFDDTQTVINQFLDSRSVDRIEREVNGGGEPKVEDEAEATADVQESG